MVDSLGRQYPSLPPELWIRILSYNTDLTHLWTVCRHVSTNFRAYTEQVFAEYVVRNTYIDFQLEKHNLGGKSKRPEIPTSFSHFELGVRPEDGGRHKMLAWFRDKRKKNEIAGNKRTEYDKIMERWESNVKNWKPEMSNYTVRIGSLVNDTPLPDLSIKIASRAVSFDWRQMYTLFFREQALLRTLKEKWKVATEEKMKLNKLRVVKGEKLSISDYPIVWTVASVEMQKEIRRKRLKEHYAENEEMVWAIDSLKHFEDHGASGGSAKAFNLNPDLPGAGVGEKWAGSMGLVQELYLDEWSSMHRIETKIEHLKEEDSFPTYASPSPTLKEARKTPAPSRTSTHVPRRG